MKAVGEVQSGKLSATGARPDNSVFKYITSDKRSDFRGKMGVIQPPAPRHLGGTFLAFIMVRTWHDAQEGDDNPEETDTEMQQPQKAQQQANKQDNLPAYCNPPNPCPVGYTVEEGCLEEFENTAAFSREYQGQQDCMCDSEHMFDCTNNQNGKDITQTDLDQLVRQFHVDEEHKTLVAKKYHAKKSSNPYLEGEKLPIAAKKGINIGN